MPDEEAAVGQADLEIRREAFTGDRASFASAGQCLDEGDW
jgi:hypothetical protein